MSEVAATRAMILTARLYRVRWDLEQILGRLNQEMMDWAPAQGMRTTAGQLVEIAGTEIQTVTRLKEGTWVSDDEVRARIGRYNELTALAAFLNETRANTLRYIGSLSPDQMEEPIDPSNYEWLNLSQVPRAEVLQTIPMHEYYHVGQLTSYLWSRGDHPYHW